MNGDLMRAWVSDSNAIALQSVIRTAHVKPHTLSEMITKIVFTFTDS